MPTWSLSMSSRYSARKWSLSKQSAGNCSFWTSWKAAIICEVMGYHQGVFKLSGKVIFSSQHVLQLGKYYISLDPNSERNSLLTSISFWEQPTTEILRTSNASFKTFYARICTFKSWQKLQQHQTVPVSLAGIPKYWFYSHTLNESIL